MKLSPWHDGSVKPVHVGVYERDWYNLDKFFDSGPYYAFFDGREWRHSRVSIDGCLEPISISSVSYYHTNIRWRGILKD